MAWRAPSLLLTAAGADDATAIHRLRNTPFAKEMDRPFAERDSRSAGCSALIHPITARARASGARHPPAERAAADGRARSSPRTPYEAARDAGAPARRNERSLRKRRERG